MRPTSTTSSDSSTSLAFSEDETSSQPFFAKFVRDTRSKVEQKTLVMQEKLPEWKSRGVLYSNKAKEASIEWSRKGKEAVDRWKKERSDRPSSYRSMQSSDETLVFGMQLDIAVALTKIEDDDLVPGVFKRCIDYLNLVGIHEVGIYRIPGSTLTVNKLKDEFNYGVDINFEETKPDPHVVGTLLKLYLRELPEAVIPSEYTREFRIALEEAPLNQPSSTLFTIRAARDMVAKLSTSSFCLLKPLCQHLKRVADNERENKMSVSNLSLIFIPTLNIERGLFNCLVEHYHKVFEEEKPAGPVPPPLPQKPRNLLIETQSEPKKLAHSKTMSDTGMYVNNIKHLNNSKTPPPKPTRSPNPTSNRSRQPPPLKPRSKSVSSPMRDMTLVATTSELDNETWKKRGRVEAIGKQFETLINDTQPISHHRKNAVLVNKPFANI